MARVVYSVSGEGRGHATRSEAVISMLLAKHSVLVYAPPLAYQILSASLRDKPNVMLRRLDCLRFQYRNERLSYALSVAKAIPFMCRLRGRVATLVQEVQDWQATHVLNDFEPLLARVAHRLSLPLISLDHQHFITAVDSSSLPKALAWKVTLLRRSIPLFCPQPDQQIISSYFDFPIRAMAATTHKVGILLRRSLQAVSPESGDHIVGYFRRDLPKRIEASLTHSKRHVFIYGLGQSQSRGNLHFRETCSDGFLEQLRTCAALVCSSGNQLIGEAIHLGKPTLAIPEAGNFEQEINGFFLPGTGGGATVPLEQVDRDTVALFLQQWPNAIDASQAAPPGNIAVQKLLDAVLDESERSVSENINIQAA